MQLSLPSNIEGFTQNPHSQIRAHNYYNIDGQLMPRNGWVRSRAYDESGRPTGSSDHIGRGMMLSADGSKLYSIFGDKLYVSTDPSFGIGTEVGTITVTSKNLAVEPSVRFAVGFTGIAISAGARQYFIDTSDDTLTQKTFDANFATSDVSYIDGRFVWVQDGGDRLVYYSEVNDALNIPALNFFDAESRPDVSKVSGVIGNDLYIFGDRTIERFRNVGAANSPFSRVNNSVISIGYVGGKLVSENKILFIGRDSSGGIGVYQLSGSSVVKISNRAVDEMLSNTLHTYSGSGVEDGLTLSESMTFNEYGRNVNVFSIQRLNNLPRYSLAAVESEGGYSWSIISDDSVSSPTMEDWGLSYPASGFFQSDNHYFGIKNVIFWNDAYYAQRLSSLSDAGLFKLDQYNSDVVDEAENSEPITRGFLAQVDVPLDKVWTLSSLRIVSSSTLTFDDSDVVNLRVSVVDGVWSNEKSVSLVSGKKIQFLFSGGIVAADGHLSILIETRANKPLFIEKVFVNV